MSEHPPHDGVEPRTEDERQQADIVDWDFVLTLSTRITLTVYTGCA